MPQLSPYLADSFRSEATSANWCYRVAARTWNIDNDSTVSYKRVTTHDNLNQENIHVFTHSSILRIPRPH